MEEIETESALKVISDQKENRVIIPVDLEGMERSSSVGIMIARNINKLGCTLSGSGTSHRVNSILVTESKLGLDEEQSGKALDKPCTYTLPTKKECKISLPSDVVTRVIPEYYGGKRTGPGELARVQNLGVPNSHYEEKANELRQRYLVWLEVRKLKTHPLLLVPGWTGFNIKTRDHIVIVESIISYLDTIDAAATDPRTASEVLSRIAR